MEFSINSDANFFGKITSIEEAQLILQNFSIKLDGVLLKADDEIIFSDASTLFNLIAGNLKS